MIRSARVGALLAAFAVHILIAGVLVFFAGRGAPPFERLEPALDVVLVSLPVPEPEPEPVQLEPVEVEAPAPDVPPEAPPEQDTEVESEPEPEPAGDVEPVTVPAEAPVSAESPTPEPQTLDVLSAAGGQGALSATLEAQSGDGGVLRGVACAGAGPSMREALGCDSPGSDLTAYAAPGAIDAINMGFAAPSEAQRFQSLYSLGLQSRPGSLMAGPDFRLSGSDSMADRLPASEPDPAFGD